MSDLRISVVVPALNEAENVAALLPALRREGFAEVVVADGGSGDGTLDQARLGGATTVACAPGRALQMNAGAGAATGDVLLFLHADTRLPSGAGVAIREALRPPAVVGGCFRLRFDSPDPVLSLYGWFSRFDSYWTTFGDQAVFARRTAFEAVRGFPEQPLMEDVAFRLALRRRGRFVKLKETVTTSARRFQTRGVLRQQALNARLLTAYALGASPERLAREYR